MFCTSCGNQVPDGARFCERCGAMMGSPAPVSQPAPQSVPQPAPQPVPQPAPQPTEYVPYAPAPVAEPVVDAPVAPPKKKKKLLPIILILAVVVVAAVVAAVLLFGKQTVYLVTETVNKNSGGSTSTIRYEYDADGRITKYEFEYNYPEISNYGEDYQYEINYEYDDDGKLETAEFIYGERSIEVEYSYKNDVLDDFEVEGLYDSYAKKDLEIECNDEGRFEYIAFLDDDGNEYVAWDYEYHDNGVVKKAARRMVSYGWETVSCFDEEGRTIESITYMGGELMYKYVYEYNEDGLQTMMEQYNSDDEVEMRYEIEYSFQKGQLASMNWHVETKGYDDELMEATMVFACEWDDLECTLVLDEIDGDEKAVENIAFAGEDVEIIFEKDKHGNTVRTEIVADGETISSTTNEYEAFKVSRNYRKPNIQNDPLYMYFLINL